MKISINANKNPDRRANNAKSAAARVFNPEAVRAAAAAYANRPVTVATHVELPRFRKGSRPAGCHIRGGVWGKR